MLADVEVSDKLNQGYFQAWISSVVTKGGKIPGEGMSNSV